MPRNYFQVWSTSDFSSSPSSFDVEKIVAQQRVQILLLYGYSYLVAISKRSVGVRIVRVSLNLDDTVVKNQLTGNVQNTNHFVR